MRFKISYHINKYTTSLNEITWKRYIFLTLQKLTMNIIRILINSNKIDHLENKSEPARPLQTVIFIHYFTLK